LFYASTFEHRKIVENLREASRFGDDGEAAGGEPEDALAIERAAHEGKIQVLVNYFIDWVPSTHTDV